MKIKATYKSTSNRRSVLIDGVEFVNNHSRTADVSKTGIAIIKKAAADGWFTIEQEWDEKGNLITGNTKETPAVEDTPAVEETPAVEDTTPAVEDTTPEEVEAPTGEETPDFSAMTKTELLDYAEENGFEVTSSMTKAKIISVITGA